ncbi:uncharacterized protein EKO05_0001736 [Ascochyta rabiei]|uniref:uncharacterized protein n=1 Tax=Didymella rabiei TaxID=5454 RepID=UPI00220C4F6A|nr:uncharacterized protein EKO05_0001736 [Ascochyta rabiei]UPX11113.1 hypothetical protein EKO05_0001736 [Ascochyta rabiei]
MSTMDGLPRDKVSFVKDIKDLIISQLQALCGPSRPDFGKFDVMYFKSGTNPPLYVARAIAYSRVGGLTDSHHKWTNLVQGDNRTSVFAAYEDLWNTLNAMTSQDMKDMAMGENTDQMLQMRMQGPVQDLSGLPYLE